MGANLSQHRWVSFAQRYSVPLNINQIVDLNGFPLNLPVRTSKTIAYRVFKIQKKENLGEEVTLYHLELIGRKELLEYMA